MREGLSSMFGMLSLVWLLIGDIVAFWALTGAVMTLIIATVDAFRGRSPLRAFRKTADWSIGALFMGLLLWISVTVMNPASSSATFIFGTSRTTVALMLAISVALLVTSAA